MEECAIKFNVSLKNIPTSNMKKRKGLDHSNLGPEPKKIKYSESSCRTLELKCVPKHLNTIALLNSHFFKFGKITNIKVIYNGDPEAALIQFQSPTEAALAHDSTDAVLNNRIIQVFWHEGEKHDKLEKNEKPPLKEVVTSKFQMNNVGKMRLSNSPRVFNAEQKVEKFPGRSVVYSTSNIRRTVYNPAVLKRVDTSSTNSSAAIPKKDKVNSMTYSMELLKKKQEFLESQYTNQKFILDKLSKTKDDKEKAALKESLHNLMKKIKESQQDLKEFLKLCNLLQKPAIVTKTEVGVLGHKASAHEIGMKAKRRPIPFSKSMKIDFKSMKIDNRPKALFVSGTNEKVVKKHFLFQLNDIEKIEDKKTGFVVTFKTRKAAEMALSANRLGKENIYITWYVENKQSPLEDVKERNITKVKDDNVNYADSDEDEDGEEDSKARSWRP